MPLGLFRQPRLPYLSVEMMTEGGERLFVLFFHHEVPTSYRRMKHFGTLRELLYPPR